MVVKDPDDFFQTQARKGSVIEVADFGHGRTEDMYQLFLFIGRYTLVAGSHTLKIHPNERSMYIEDS